MVTTRIGELDLVGGHRALDLVNTVAPRVPAGEAFDHLQSPGDLLVWSQRTGLIDPVEGADVAAAWSTSPSAGRRALGAVKETREALYQVLAARIGGPDGSAPTREELDHLSLAWASTVSRARLTPVTGGVGVARWVVGSPPALLVTDRVAQDAVDLLTAVDIERLGSCPVDEGGCGWLFLDHTRNHSRRWCTMEACGSGAKSRRLTERRRRSRASNRN